MPRPSAVDELKRTAGRPRLLVRRDALLQNLQVLRQAAGGLRVCGVIKANAYGHGVGIVADTLINLYTETLPAPAADALAVATLEEAEALYEELGDLEVPLYVLRPVENVYLGENRQTLEGVIRRKGIVSLISTAAVDDVARAAERLGVRAGVQVMLDTGMTREGCEPHVFAEVVKAVLARPALRLVAISTHLTDGELEEEPYSDEQLRMFHELVDPLFETLPAAARESVILHAANSGGTFFAPDDTLDMIRPGISLYGVDPGGGPDVARKLRPVARWTAPLISVRDVTAGTCVGYGRAWRATTATRIGLVPVGYADGYRRSLSNRSVVRVPAPGNGDGTAGRDVFCPVVGRVSMDYLTIDLAQAPWARIGDEIVLMDDNPLSPCSVYALAEQAGTIPYEIFTGIGPRVARVAV